MASTGVLGGSGLTVSAAPADFQRELEARYAKPDQTNNTELRWWLAQGSHTDETIVEEIKTMHEQGFTGVELCMLDDATIDTEKYAYGSAEAVHDWTLAIETATEYGMSVGLTSGTHWKAANIRDWTRTVRQQGSRPSVRRRQWRQDRPEKESLRFQMLIYRQRQKDPDRRICL